MVRPILKFAACCRESEFFVSTAEVLDTVKQLSLVAVLDERTFKTVLGANFVKTQRDWPQFETLYNLFFHDLQSFPPSSSKAHQSEKTALEQILADISSEIQSPDPEDNDTQIDAALLNFLSGDPQPYLEMLQQMNVPEDTPKGPLKSNLGELANRMGVLLKINRIRSRTMSMANELLTDDPVTRQQVDEYFKRLLDRAYSLMSEESRPDNVGLREIKQVEKQFQTLGETSFFNLTQKEIDSMRDVIDRLVRRLQDVVIRRFASRNRGVIDIKKTLRIANRFQGVPLSIQYKKKPPKKGKIVTLCDVSGSVWSAARFMLNILYSLQDCFSGVKSYIFISGVADVSGLFARHPINTAIEKAMTEADIDYNALTDYGETFLQFKDQHLQELNKRTTLIIIGDGRSNYMNPRTEVLDEMREKCKRMIWLNPESMNSWNSGDSEMRQYRRYCHEIRPCQNLNQLTAFVTDLVI